MDIVRDNGNSVNAADASKAVFSSMFNGTILVLLGGFAIAAALSKHGITKAFAAVVLSKAGTRPQYVILVNMYLAAFLCMWISNVATPVLCFSLVQVKFINLFGRDCILMLWMVAYFTHITTAFFSWPMSYSWYCSCKLHRWSLFTDFITTKHHCYPNAESESRMGYLVCSRSSSHHHLHINNLGHVAALLSTWQNDTPD